MDVLGKIMGKSGKGKRLLGDKFSRNMTITDEDIDDAHTNLFKGSQHPYKRVTPRSSGDVHATSGLRLNYTTKHR